MDIWFAKEALLGLSVDLVVVDNGDLLAVIESEQKEALDEFAFVHIDDKWCLTDIGIGLHEDDLPDEAGLDKATLSRAVAELKAKNKGGGSESKE